MIRRRKHRHLPWHKGHRKHRVAECDKRVPGVFGAVVFGGGTVTGGSLPIAMAHRDATLDLVRRESTLLQRSLRIGS